MQGDRARRSLGHTTGPVGMYAETEEKPRQVADEVAERIERLILDGVLKAGQALPSERRLTEAGRVAHGAARRPEAAARARDHPYLAGQGLVRGPDLQGGRRAADAPVQLSQPRTLYDLLEVRSLLEAESARLAALRGTEADFIMIRRRYDEMMASQGIETDAATHAHLDHAFHRAICEASHNPVLVHTLQSLTDLLLGSVFACVNNLYHREPEKTHRPAACAPVQRRDRASARAGPARRRRARGQRAPEPGGHRAGRAAPGARDAAAGGLGLGRRAKGCAPACGIRQAPDCSRLANVVTLDVSGRSIPRCPGPGACRHRRGQSGSAAGSPARSSPARQNRVAAARPASPGPTPRRCRRRSRAGWR